MKTIQITNYTFNKTAQTITFNDFTTIELGKILSIVDVTNGQSIYNYRLPGMGGTVATNVLTLQFNTNNNQFNNSDKLYIEMSADNLAIPIVASAVRTATYTSPEINNYGFTGGIFIINTTAVSGDTPSMTVSLEMKDAVSGEFMPIPGASTAAITATGKTALAVYPGLTVSANAKVDYILPRTYRVVATISGTTPSFTFSISINYTQ